MKALIAALLIVTGANAFADCPAFASRYHHCHSTNPVYSVEEIRVKSRMPYFNFSFWNQGLFRRFIVVTDGEPRDVTIQTQDGSEATYIETASCNLEQLKIVRTSEENSLKEETLFMPSGEYMKVRYLVDGVLQNETTCHAASSF